MHSNDNDDRSVVWYVTHPFAALGALLGVFQPDLLLGLLDAIGGLLVTWFPVVSMANTVSGAFGLLPPKLTEQVFLTAAAALLVYYAYKATDTTLEKL